ncbi:MAG: hypothetical protein M1836_006589 [Candelina mexicana]|nr:MAG: hypothetical protein M1836_006589 [Candelina mexicana]
MVDLYVGPEHKLFRVHKKLICNRSAFFDKALNGKFKEGQAGIMYLFQGNPTSFEIFVTWLYMDSIEPVPRLEDKDEWPGLLARFLDLYILADRLCINVLNTAMDRIQQALRANNLTISGEHTRIYNNTVTGSPLRRFLAQLAAWDLQGTWGRDVTQYLKEGANLDVAGDIIDLLRRCEALPDPREPSECEYHEHAEGETCHLKEAKE